MNKNFLQTHKTIKTFFSPFLKPSNFFKCISPPCLLAQDTKFHRNVASLQYADSPIAVDSFTNPIDSPVTPGFVNDSLSEDPVSSGVFVEEENHNNLTNFDNFSDPDFGSESEFPSGFYPDGNTHPAY